MYFDRSKLMQGVLLAFAAIALLFLVMEHRAHALGPLLHVLQGACVVLLYLGGRLEEPGNPDSTGLPTHQHEDPD
jgi:hypothetical protein